MFRQSDLMVTTLNLLKFDQLSHMEITLYVLYHIPKYGRSSSEEYKKREIAFDLIKRWYD